MQHSNRAYIGYEKKDRLMSICLDEKKYCNMIQTVFWESLMYYKIFRKCILLGCRHWVPDSIRYPALRYRFAVLSPAAANVIRNAIVPYCPRLTGVCRPLTPPSYI